MDINNTTELGKVKIVLVKGEKGDAGADGVSGDYAGLTNKPSINNVQLSGDKSGADLGLAPLGAFEDLNSAVYRKDEIDDKFVVDASDASAMFESVEERISTSPISGSGTVDVKTSCPFNKFVALNAILFDDTTDYHWALQGYYVRPHEADQKTVIVAMINYMGTAQTLDLGRMRVVYTRIK